MNLQELKDEVKEVLEGELDQIIKENPDFDRDSVESELRDNGRDHEIVDSAVPVYNDDLMSVANCTEIYNHNNELGPANGSNFDGEPSLINFAAANIYEVLSEYAGEFVQEYLDDHDFDEEEDDDEEDDGIDKEEGGK